MCKEVFGTLFGLEEQRKLYMAPKFEPGASRKESLTVSSHRLVEIL